MKALKDMKHNKTVEKNNVTTHRTRLTHPENPRLMNDGQPPYHQTTY